MEVGDSIGYSSVAHIRNIIILSKINSPSLLGCWPWSLPSNNLMVPGGLRSLAANRMGPHVGAAKSNSFRGCESKLIQVKMEIIYLKATFKLTLLRILAVRRGKMTDIRKLMIQFWLTMWIAWKLSGKLSCIMIKSKMKFLRSGIALINLNYCNRLSRDQQFSLHILG